MSSNKIAIVGVACRYPDAASPTELWENVLSQRQAFRRMPPERLPLADYYSPDPVAPDKTYSQNAALITSSAPTTVSAVPENVQSYIFTRSNTVITVTSNTRFLNPQS